jgi:hypothetical protein
MKIFFRILILLILPSTLPAQELKTLNTKDRIPVEMTPWRSNYDIIEGWDWSLPVGVKPVPYSGMTMPWPKVNNKRYDLPGNEVARVNSSWKELEPEEGKYNFEPLLKRILESVKDYDGVELHVFASVWEIKNFPGPNTDYPPDWLEQQKKSNESAPRWLEKYNIAKVPGRPRFNLTTPFQIINMDLFNSDYHRRYLKFVKAFGESGIPQMKEVMYCYLQFASGSRGEEGMEIPIDDFKLKCLKERIKAWAEAFKGVEYKLEIVSSRGPEVDYAFSVGTGQRNGFVDMVMQDANNPKLGQVVDENGYLTVDESILPIAENRAFGDENEEFGRGMIPRFGPWETFAHRYRESMLRTLQMRRNFLMIEPTMMNPPLTAYVSMELGRNVKNTPDIWCYLRESVINSKNGPLPVKNFERWLYQRDSEGHKTFPTAKVFLSDSMQFYHKDHKYDYTARSTNQAIGNTSIGFAVDDRFLYGGPNKVAVKITYHDQGKSQWALVYNHGKNQRNVICQDCGLVRTVTFFLDDVVFDARELDYDFEIKAIKGDAIIKLVRIIKL